MPFTSQLSQSARVALRALWIAGLLGLALFAVHAGLDVGNGHEGAFQALNVVIYLIPAALCICRGVLVREERLPWLLMGIGMASWAGGYAHYFLVLAQLETPPYPSFSDALWLVFYAASGVALVMLLRARFTGVRRGLWLDALTGTLTLAALGAAVLVGPILASTGGRLAAVATNLAYPLADVLILAMVLGGFALSGWRPTRTWWILAAAFACQAGFDTVYLYQTASGTYTAGTLLDVSWPAIMLVIAAAAWRTPERPQPAREGGRAVMVVPLLFALVALGITTVDSFSSVSTVAVVLATVVLVLAFVRSATTFADVRSLALRRELGRRHKLILDSAGDGIYGLDREGRVVFANAAAARLTGHAEGELMHSDVHALVHHTRADGTPYPAEQCPVQRSLTDGEGHLVSDEVYFRKDGTSFPVEYTSTPIRDNGDVEGAVVVFKDITERREVERVKDEFTSVVSHELRTPLTSVRGSLGLLESGVLGPLPEKGQRMVEIAVENTDRLVRLINDILDIERIDSGQIDMHPVDCDARDLIARANEAVASLATEGEVTLVVDAEPARLSADADRIIQTLTNLLANAVKFSPPGSSVRVSSLPRDGEVLFEVSDEGRGIPPENLDTIFGRFQQVDASDSRQKGGTGLGLAICRSIVSQHGGRIWGDSVLGEGSTFSFVLPAPFADDLGRVDRDDGHGPAVLVCDDDASVVEVVGAVLEQRGYRVIPARSGEQALQRALAEPPDAILLDLLMPGKSGWETAAALAEHPETRDIPIVILSVLPPDDTEAPDGPIVEWVIKPLDDVALFAALERAIGPREEAYRVLIVEDDPDLASVLIATFERHGVETFHAATGLEAIELSQRALPDLLVLDLGLPEADGFAVVDWLRRHDRLNAVPLVVYTGRDLDESDRERLRLGSSTEFLTKGRVTPESFELRVMALLGRLTKDHIREGIDERQAHPVGR